MKKNIKKNTVHEKKPLTTRAALKMEKRDLAKILKDIQKDKIEAENQRKAILNILEDVNSAQEKLNKKYQELQTVSELTHSLGLSLETSSAIDSAGKAINSVIPGLIVVFCLAPLNQDQTEVEMNIYSNQHISEKNLRLIKTNVYASLNSRCSGDFCKAPISQFEVNFLKNKITRNKKETSSKPLINHLNTPLNVLGKSIGLVSVFEQGEKKFSKNQLPILSTIIDNLSQAIERLRTLASQENSRFSNLVDSMSDGVIMFDLNKRVLLVNPQARKVIGDQAQNKSLDTFLKAIHGARKNFNQSIGFKNQKKKINMNTVVSEVMKSSQAANYQDVVIHNRTYEFFVTPIKDFKHKISGGAIVMHDITNLKEINKLKSEFVSVASHQLRTPLTSIRLFAETILDGSVGSINQEQEEYIEHIHESAISMIQLVNNLLNLSRIEAGKLDINIKTINAIDFISNIVSDVAAIAKERGIKVIFKKPIKKSVNISTDPNLLKQVVYNLVVNAIKYSHQEKPEVHISLGVTREKVSISIKDFGIGIPVSMQEDVFVKFFRADNAVKTETDGNGLGLYIAKTITEGLGGLISFTSKEGKGTIFNVKLPYKSSLK